MTSAEGAPRASLSSLAPSERARAATWLLSHAQAISTRDLVRALQDETVPQVRRILLEVLELRQQASLSRQPAASERVAPAETKAREFPTPTDAGDIAALVRHELAPAVGWIRLAADAEIPGFASSSTNDAIRRLQLRIDGLVTLIMSRAPLDIRTVDLPLELRSSWPDPTTSPRIAPRAEEATAEICTDQGLFALLLSNIFQNAIDASVDAVGAVDVDVVWGVTEGNYWVRVTNPFRGQRLTFGDVAADGFSSKPGHLGKGLALIKRIADRLNVAVDLDGASGTASFVLKGERRRA